MADINMTPFIDVMLVLLIIFMVAAPLLTAGVPIDLPQTRAAALNIDEQPLTVSVNGEGRDLSVEDQPVAASTSSWPSSRRGRKGEDYDERIYVRGDKAVNYGRSPRSCRR